MELISLLTKKDGHWLGCRMILGSFIITSNVSLASQLAKRPLATAAAIQLRLISDCVFETDFISCPLIVKPRYNSKVQ